MSGQQRTEAERRADEARGQQQVDDFINRRAAERAAKTNPLLDPRTGQPRPAHRTGPGRQGDETPAATD